MRIWWIIRSLLPSAHWKFGACYKQENGIEAMV